MILPAARLPFAQPMDPIHFALGLHLHQPVGNFDHVFEEHVREVYRPFLDRVERHGLFPLLLHVSGPLLDWLEGHDPAYLDQIGRLAADGRLELLLAGYYEPVLASLPRPDRREQIGWMRQRLASRFGVEATGLWLTERVWEPELAADLAEAGVEYALVDDRHFLVTGFTPGELHRPWRTESDGRKIGLFAIDERLRYLIPFRPPSETADYLRQLRDQGHRLAVLADDGEKFGGWPGTRRWVYDEGWLDQFLDLMTGLIARDEIRMTRLDDALRRLPSAGLAYLPTASYREMETWSLPARAAVRLMALERELGDRMSGPEGALLRGAHWRNFFVKYPESNRMNKKMLALSRLARERGNPPAVREAIGRAQCNDAYWHGVFGGLYLRHLREAVWHNLALAEQALRREEPLTAEWIDLDMDGHEEIWIHSAHFSALVSPARGGALEELTLFRSGVNHADVLTRRLEYYHMPAQALHAARQGGASSIHDLEASLRSEDLPPFDDADRALFVDRILAPGTDAKTYAAARAEVLWIGAAHPLEAEIQTGDGVVEVRLQGPVFPGGGRLRKTCRFEPDGACRISFEWPAEAGPAGASFATELSLLAPLSIKPAPRADRWHYTVTTVAKSERGFDTTVQGEAQVVLWPIERGKGEIELRAED